jgi:hypothetical protein
MTSQLNVDTIVDKAGSGGTNVKVGNTSTYVSDGGATTQNTVQGLAKAWNKFQGDAGSISVDDSFNASSLEDVGTGEYRSIYTNNMNNDDYAHSVSSAFYSGVGSDTDTTTSRIRYFNGNASGSLVDGKEIALIIMGDLA